MTTTTDPTRTALATPIGDDGAHQLASPGVGLFRDPPQAGAWITPGARVGTLQVLNTRYELLAPAGVSGHVANVDLLDRVTGVEYGQALFRVVPGSGAGMPGASTTAASGAGAASAGNAAADVPGGVTVKASTVGTFYSRPSPDAPPYVAEGDVIQPGATLGLIEVMKVFNPISWSGEGPMKVVRLLAADGAEVSAGQVLVVLAPA
ncbi:MAG: acetyl-CoA carboxylase biotin carboxyl carrier protein subunit [Planctomycetota bacterium]